MVQFEEPTPWAIRQQRWSPINVPLMWAAAGGDTTPVLDWLVERMKSCEPVVHYGDSMEASVAARTGWLALKGAMRSWGVHSREELSIWLRRQGFPGPAPGNHISARAQEFILTEGCSHDGRVTLLESSFVTLVLHTGRTQTVQNSTSVAERPRVSNVHAPLQCSPTVGHRWTECRSKSCLLSKCQC